jgi:hypothetical protein
MRNIQVDIQTVHHVATSGRPGQVCAQERFPAQQFEMHHMHACRSMLRLIHRQCASQQLPCHTAAMSRVPSYHMHMPGTCRDHALRSTTPATLPQHPPAILPC